ncbi:hypothetical protein QEH52_01845 [Coraliomargarita sp. SDUM461003]|uniref:Argininosuccinate lyase n=1 Tax=Thalassobacterium maritimum TaxID=3041265 RepID=A0ABU1APZ1_9BACT|nr:hypothetical protein [Coraliomargarita sp. SDUM461003]MDQ8206235.1 hypothetical protein [Coraliomargarita sp. SDUM461003]
MVCRLLAPIFTAAALTLSGCIHQVDTADAGNRPEPLPALPPINIEPID